MRNERRRRRLRHPSSAEIGKGALAMKKIIIGLIVIAVVVTVIINVAG